VIIGFLICPRAQTFVCFVSRERIPEGDVINQKVLAAAFISAHLLCSSREASRIIIARHPSIHRERSEAGSRKLIFIYLNKVY